VKKVLLVCAEDCAELEKDIGCSGCVLLKAGDSSAAISCVRHQRLDAAILVSTGADMDVTETALNLGDINRSLEIIIVASSTQAREFRTAQGAHALGIGRIKFLTGPELSAYLAAQR
jgi:hypothetical protein